MMLVDLPPLTALAAFHAVQSDMATIVVVANDQVRVSDAGTAARMYAWVDDWVDAVTASVFSHPARRRP